MERLIEVVKLVANKYIDEVEIILDKNFLTLQYMYEFNGQRDVYKIMQVTENKDKINVLFLPEKLVKVVDIKGLEDIFDILSKQIIKKNYNKEEVDKIKEKYQKGTRIKLIKMYDLYAPKPGTMGIVENVDSAGQIHVKWENNSSLALIVGIDKFEIINNTNNEISKLKNEFKVGQIRPFVYNNIVHKGKILKIDNETAIYTIEDLEINKTFEVSIENVFLGDD